MWKEARKPVGGSKSARCECERRSPKYCDASLLSSHCRRQGRKRDMTTFLLRRGPHREVERTLRPTIDAVFGAWGSKPRKDRATRRASPMKDQLPMQWCYFCGQRFTVPHGREPLFVVSSQSGARTIQIVTVDGNEIHRCDRSKQPT